MADTFWNFTHPGLTAEDRAERFLSLFPDLGRTWDLGVMKERLVQMLVAHRQDLADPFDLGPRHDSEDK